VDIIFIENLEVEAVLGILPHERTTAQRVVFDIQFFVDIRAAVASENIESTVSYAEVAEAVSDLAVSGRYQLVETLAEHCAEHILKSFGVPWVRLKVTKPDAVAKARGVGVLIERGQRPSGHSS